MQTQARSTCSQSCIRIKFIDQKLVTVGPPTTNIFEQKTLFYGAARPPYPYATTKIWLSERQNLHTGLRVSGKL